MEKSSADFTSRAPRVSIGMPVYQAERYIEETLESICRQTFTDFELIISDNASHDRTEDICRRFAARDDRIRYLRNAKNMGAAYNYNLVAQLARGEFFKHAAYDDLLLPTYLERLVELLDCEPNVVLAYPRCEVIDANGVHTSTGPAATDLISRQPQAHMRLRRYFPRGGADGLCDPVFGLFRTAVFRQTRMLGRYISADAILLGEVLLYGEIDQVPELLFQERYHPKGSVMSNPTIDARFAWFDPAITPRSSNRLYYWRWLFELVRAIHRAPLDAREKLLCYLELRGFTRRYWAWLLISIGWAVNFSARQIFKGIVCRDKTALAAAFS